MFYFTFGLGGNQLFDGGWVRVAAANRAEAVEKFKQHFGPAAMVGAFVNCASIYSEEEFRKTIMHEYNDNLGCGEIKFIK